MVVPDAHKSSRPAVSSASNAGPVNVSPRTPLGLENPSPLSSECTSSTTCPPSIVRASAHATKTCDEAIASATSPRPWIFASVTGSENRPPPGFERAPKRGRLPSAESLGPSHTTTTRSWASTATRGCAWGFTLVETRTTGENVSPPSDEILASRARTVPCRSTQTTETS